MTDEATVSINDKAGDKQADGTTKLPALQKTAKRVVKGRLSPCKKRPFARRKAAFCNCTRNSL